MSFEGVVSGIQFLIVYVEKMRRVILCIIYRILASNVFECYNIRDSANLLRRSAKRPKRRSWVQPQSLLTKVRWFVLVNK